MDSKVLQKIEQTIGYEFSNRDLLRKAFAHSSATSDRTESNERLEFLGDAILGMVICCGLFDRFPEYLEGDLTKIKSMFVSRKTCAHITKDMELQQFLKVGKGMITNRALTGSIAAGLLEAVIGAIYLDGGFEKAQTFILTVFADLFEQTNAKQSHGNFKSIMQQYAQQTFNATPDYNLLDEKGPDHDKCFESEVVINGRHFPSAWGNNKKDAEQKAAFNALEELGILKDHHL